MDGGHPRIRPCRSHRRTRAIALGFSSWVALSQPGTETDLGPIEWSVALFHSVGDGFGEGLALAALSVACMAASPPDLERAEGLLRRALEFVTAEHDPTFEAHDPRARSATWPSFRATPTARSGSSTASSRTRGGLVTASSRASRSRTPAGRGWRAARRDPSCSRGTWSSSLRLGNEDGDGYAFEGTRRPVRRSSATSSVPVSSSVRAETARHRTRTPRAALIRHVPVDVERILASDGAAEFEAARGRGRRMPRRAGDRPRTRSGGSRVSAMTRQRRRGPDPHARPAAARLRQLDPEGARTRASRRARGDRAAAARPRHVRAGRAPASAARAVPRLPRAERRVRRHLLAAVRLDRARRGDLRPRGRVPARPAATCRSSSTSSSRRNARSASASSWPGSATTAPRRTRRSRPPRSWPSLIAADLATLLAERFDASRRAGLQRRSDRGLQAPTGRIPAPYTDGGGTRVRGHGAAHLAGRGRAAPRHPRRPGRHRQEPPRDRGRPPRRAAVRPGDVRVARARARSRGRAPRDRTRARGARRRRSAALRAAGRGARRPPRPHRARQLRAGARRGARRRDAADRPARRDVPRHESREAPRARRAGLRRRSARGAARPRPGDRRRDPRVARPCDSSATAHGRRIPGSR